ncbi:sugar ABC transporter permease [Saccharopolyspora sp. K220]|uniref:carbohydrate ABC transporter permease n=1 Tax=Saccharopolyspora soli TaxID=2926618 RepID=UPI001F5777C4|nr:sugar ABC transporter permease [Saccharopolyspora soli]MCI2417866.1 sugar ABC transporter permease [Saccharopolyspora soli]
MSPRQATVAPEEPLRPTVDPPLPSRRRRRRDTAAAWAFLSPWVLGLVLITLGPMAYSLYLSFTRFDLFNPPEWIGLGNYADLLGADPRFWQSVRVTLHYVAVSVPLVLVVSLLLAMVLNRGLRGLGVYRALFYLPSLLGTSVAIAVLWRQVFGEDGLVNHVLRSLGFEAHSWIGDPRTALYTLVVLSVWTFGATMVIFLAGLRQIPGELYDAAEADGAGRLRRFWHITLPHLSPVVLFNGLLATVNAFQAFAPAYVVSRGSGGPADSTLFYTLYLYERGFKQFQMGYASAMAWLLLLGLAVFAGLLFASARYWVHYGDQR